LYDEIEQIMVKGYVTDEKMKTEGIEAFVYPNYEAFGNKGQDSASNQEMESRIDAIIKEVNLELMPYKRIERFKLLDEPLEMTTTKKIKRFKVDGESGE
jgi:long-chain acyl-CoA synthetase